MLDKTTPKQEPARLMPTRARRSNELSRQLASDLKDLFDRYPLKKPPPSLLRDIEALNRVSASQRERIRILEGAMRLISEKKHAREEYKFTIDLVSIYVNQSPNCLMFANEGISLASAVLYDLLEALDELDRGLVEVPLQPKKLDHRPPDTWLVEDFKRNAAAACEALMRRGETQHRATSQVARSVNSYRLLADKRVTSIQILNWRKRFRTDRQYKFWVDYFLRSKLPILTHLDHFVEYQIEIGQLSPPS